MFSFDLLKDKFVDITLSDDKIRINSNFIDVMNYLKNTPEFDFDVLTSIIAVDLQGEIELIYNLYSINTTDTLKLSLIVSDTAPSATGIFKSAYFDECEIYDMFGVKFEGNSNLKRLFMPETWVGHPMLKSYKLEDERLVWNE